jgi:hypothetical protein
MNTLVFISLLFLSELAVVWISYTVGHQNGWLRGWEDRRGSK